MLFRQNIVGEGAATFCNTIPKQGLVQMSRSYIGHMTYRKSECLLAVGKRSQEAIGPLPVSLLPRGD